MSTRTERELVAELLESFIDDSNRISLQKLKVVPLKYRDIDLWRVVTQGIDEAWGSFEIQTRKPPAPPPRAKPLAKRSQGDLVGDLLCEERSRAGKARKASQPGSTSSGAGGAAAASGAGGAAAASAAGAAVASAAAASASAGAASNASLPDSFADVKKVLQSAGLQVGDLWDACGVADVLQDIPVEVSQELADLFIDELAAEQDAPVNAESSESDHDAPVEPQTEPTAEDVAAAEVAMDSEAGMHCAEGWPWSVIVESRPWNFIDKKTRNPVGVIQQLAGDQRKATCKVAGHGKCVCWVSLRKECTPAKLKQLEAELIDWLASGTIDTSDVHKDKSVSLRIANGMNVKCK